MALARSGGGVQQTPVSMTMTAAGARMEVSRGTGLDLAVKTDALRMGTAVTGTTGPSGNLGSAEAGVTRLRAGIEGARSYTLMRRLALARVATVPRRRG